MEILLGVVLRVIAEMLLEKGIIRSPIVAVIRYAGRVIVLVVTAPVTALEHERAHLRALANPNTDQETPPHADH